jgi:formylglycine-generating enzyme required for sulfatase activity
MQRLENEKLSKVLDGQKNQLETANQQLEIANQNLQLQEERFTGDLKKLAERLNRTEEELNKSVQLTEKWKTQAQGRTAEYERLAKESETDKARFQKLAREEQARADELAQRLESLQTKAKTAMEQVTQVQKEVATRPGHIFRDKLKAGGEGPEMKILAAGNFLMGSLETERGRFKNEGPQRRVTISNPFALSIHEITFADYDTFAKASGRRLPGDEGWGREDRPVIYVSWEDATAYAQWLSEQTGQHYRLPTEAEWEYAARAGSTTAYSFGDDPSRLTDYAWFDSNSNSNTHPVGTRKPNPWGIYDMHGNVWEWVEDDWHRDYVGASYDGSAWIDEPRGAYRVIRGGGWIFTAQDCRSAFRNNGAPGDRYLPVGFRLARSVALGP